MKLATMSGMASTVSPTNRQTTTQVVEPCSLTDAGKETVSAELIRWSSDCNITLTGPSSSEILSSYTYTAREWDSTIGLHHFRARWMIGLTGRFLTSDLIRFKGSPYDLYE